eukprot:1612581-Lingulodinium_polyedra.AAC.1
MCGWPLECPMAFAPWISWGPKGPARAQLLQHSGSVYNAPRAQPPCVSTIAGWRGELPFRTG